MREENPIPTFSYLITELRRRFPNLGYLHMVEPGISGAVDQDLMADSNDFARAIWQPRPFIVAGRYTSETALHTAEEKGGLIAFGRWFVSNVSLDNAIWIGY